MSDGNWWDSFAKDQYGKSVQFDQESGTYKPKGFGALLWSQVTDDEDEVNIQKTKQKNFVADYATGQGVDGSKLNLTGTESLNEVKGKVLTHLETKAETKGNKDFTRQMTAAMAPAQATLAQSALQNQLQMEMLRDDRAQRQENRADDMALRREQLQREDLRYNENVRRLEDKDRKETLNTFITGLAQLGAAFAA